MRSPAEHRVTKALGELTKLQNSVNAVSSGATDDSDWSGEWTTQGCLGTPSDMGNAVGLFCSEEDG